MMELIIWDVQHGSAAYLKTPAGKHIVIEAQANKHEQLGYFKAVLDVDGVLENVKSTSGLKSGNTITITIEGDLP